MTLYIKNMACRRCQVAVKTELEKLGLNRNMIISGEVKVAGLSPSKREQLKIALKKSGFELMDPQKVSMVKKIENIIDELIYYSEDQIREFLPEYLSKKLKYEYSYLVNLFSDVHNSTIEKYFTIHKIERVKELLIYYRLNLNEIAYQLNYDNIAQLSIQFKEVTGISPCKFQNIKRIRQSAQEKVGIL